MKKFIRLASLAMAGLAVAACLASCGDDSGNKGTETTTASGASDSNSTVDKVKDLYGSLDYSGRKFRILALEAGEQWYNFISDTANEVWFEDAGSDVLQKAIYERNDQTQKLLGIEIEPVWGGGSENIYKRLVQDTAAGVDDYDVAFLSLANALTAAQGGTTMNFNNTETFDPTHKWWDEEFIKECTLYNEDLYAVAGALNIWDDCSNNCYIFNKDLLEKYDVDSPYDSVFDGTWTLDTLVEDIKKLTVDVNGDQDFDENDNWGIGTYGNGVRFALCGFDGGIAKMAEEGYPEIVCNNETTIQKCKDWFDKVTNSDCLYNLGVNGTTSYEDLFEQGQLGFGMTNLTHPFKLRNMSDEYGILPEPKYNTEQQDYTSTVNTAFFTAYVLPKNCQDPNMAAACLEVMSGFSVDTLDDSLHTILFGSKLTRDQESRKILTILSETISFDWSGIGDWNNGLVACFEMRQGSSFTLASSLASTVDSAQTGLDSMLESFSTLQ